MSDPVSQIPSMWLQVLQFILNILILGGVGIWRLAQAEHGISNKFENLVEDHKEEMRLEMTALKDRHNETERWILEQFVRREDLKAAIDKIDVTLAGLSQRFDTRLDRIENKIDSLNPPHKNNGSH